MKQLIALVICMMQACIANAYTKFVFTPTWTAQAQFAGYYVAQEKGFFREEGLSVEIKHLKPYSKKTPCDMIEEGESNIICISLLKAIQARDAGLNLINVLQTSQNTGLMCVSPDKLPSLKYLHGKKLGTWKTGYREIVDIALKESGTEVEWVPFLKGVNLFVAKAVDATLCYSYNEYIQLVMARGEIPEENKIAFIKTKYNIPEEGLYVTQEFYESHRSEIIAFVRACKKGWDYCREHQDEAVEIVMRYVKADKIVTNKFHQRMMLAETLRLQQSPSSARNNRPGTATYAPVSNEMFQKVKEMLRSIGALKGDVKYKDFIKPVKH